MNPHVSVITLGVGDLNRAWGGSSGYFADPDGFLWKVASAAATTSHSPSNRSASTATHPLSPTNSHG